MNLGFRSPARHLALVVSLGLSGLFVSCAHPARKANDAPVQRFELSQPQMGVPFRLVVYATNEQHATTAIRAAYAEAG